MITKKNLKEDVVNDLLSFFKNFFIKNYEISIVQDFFFYNGISLYKINYLNEEINYIKLDKDKIDENCNCLIIFNDLNIISQDIFEIIDKKANDLVFILSYNDIFFDVKEKKILQNYVYLKKQQEILKTNFFRFKSFHILKKVDNPNLDETLLIQSICNDNPNKYSMINYKNDSLQVCFNKIILEIKNSIKNKTHLSYLRFGDGDFYLLRNWNHGSAAIGSRSILKQINNAELKIIRQSFWQTKNICVERIHQSYNSIYLEVLFSYLDNIMYIQRISFFLGKLQIRKILYKLFIVFLNSSFLNYFCKKNFFYKFLNYFILYKTKQLDKLQREDLYEKFKYQKFIASEAIYSLVSTRFIFKKL